jgi:putative chitinase
MNKTAFYDAIRPIFPNGISGVQFKVIDAILDQADEKQLSNASLAYILATAWGEAKFTPCRENMNYTAQGIKNTWRTRPEAVQFAKKPQELANSVYGDRMGNKAGTNDGWLYRGGGIDQLTGRENYRKIGLENDPEAILHPDKAVMSIMHGMTTGRYTGKKLSDYHSAGGFDYVGARAIINGDVKLNGQKYADYAAQFLKALELASVAAAPLPSPAPVRNHWLAVIIEVIIRMLGKVK